MTVRKVNVAVESLGSIVLLTPLTAEVRTWCDANVGDDETIHLGDSIVVEPRFVQAILEGLDEAELLTAAA